MKSNLSELIEAINSNKLKDVNLPREGILPLRYAVKEGNSNIVKLFLEHGANPNAKDKSKETILLTALSCLKDAQNDYNYNKYKKIIGLLLNNGADINAASSVGHTPLGCVIICLNRLEDQLSFIKLFLQIGADPNAETGKGTAAFAAIDNARDARRIIDLLLDYGADLTALNSIGQTLLIRAAFRGDVRLLNYLLDKHVIDVNLADNLGFTPLMALLENTNLSHHELKEAVLLLLRAGAILDLHQNKYQETVFDLAKKRDLDLLMLEKSVIS